MKLQSMSNVSKKKPRNKCHKVILIGDSHARECAQKLSSYLNNSYNILAEDQYGFRSYTSTEQAIYQLTNNILKALDSKQLVGGIFCDLTKAFDCVDHDILLDKLEFYGITGIENNLIKSYLMERYQRVIIKNKSSNIYYSKWNKIIKGFRKDQYWDLCFFSFILMTCLAQ